MISRFLRLIGSVLDPRVYLRAFRILNFYGYAYVRPRRRMALGPGVRLSPNASIRNGERISIGARAHIGERSCPWAGDSRGAIDIGADALFGPEVLLTASDYRYDLGSPVMAQPKCERDITIGRDVWLGARVVVAGVTVGTAASSVRAAW